MNLTHLRWTSIQKKNIFRIQHHPKRIKTQNLHSYHNTFISFLETTIYFNLNTIKTPWQTKNTPLAHKTISRELGVKLQITKSMAINHPVESIRTGYKKRQDLPWGKHLIFVTHLELVQERARNSFISEFHSIFGLFESVERYKVVTALKCFPLRFVL